MNPFDLNVVYREALGSFEGFRKLGFSADDIYFKVAGYIPGPVKVDGPRRPEMVGPGYQVVVLLRCQELQYAIACGYVDDDPDNIERTWKDFCVAVNEGRVTREDLDRIWEECMVSQNASAFVDSLIYKGFNPPAENWDLN